MIPSFQFSLFTHISMMFFCSLFFVADPSQFNNIGLVKANGVSKRTIKEQRKEKKKGEKNIKQNKGHHE